MNELKIRKFVNILAFICLILCAILVSVSKWVPYLGEIASWVALFVVAFSAFIFIRAKRSPVYMFIFIICIALIVGFKIWILI